MLLSRCVCSSSSDQLSRASRPLDAPVSSSKHRARSRKSSSSTRPSSLRFAVVRWRVNQCRREMAGQSAVERWRVNQRCAAVRWRVNQRRREMAGQSAAVRWRVNQRCGGEMAGQSAVVRWRVNQRWRDGGSISAAVRWRVNQCRREMTGQSVPP
ncbi:hypothetical protein RRG08_055020 [Elysia crispata]|uniref:Uncharacterized protein n=1 Tax=Elysia crispata TaxID=231223 RepID=A0AAE0XRZ9_9GAST|nr:hypothetical protein RRG08_055020 [Elysia crispata]